MSSLLDVFPFLNRTNVASLGFARFREVSLEIKPFGKPKTKDRVTNGANSSEFPHAQILRTF